MSTYRPECGNATAGTALPDDTALYLIESVRDGLSEYAVVPRAEWGAWAGKTGIRG